MLLRPRKHPRFSDEPVSPADIAESLLAMGLMAWMIAPVPFLWFPPAWVLALMTPVERPRGAVARSQPALPAAARVPALPPPQEQATPPVPAPVQAKAAAALPPPAKPRRASRRESSRS